jgi:chaperone required for assembly of F1-ATPase
MSERPKPAAKPLPPLRVAATESGFRVMVGDRPWTTPGGAELAVPSRPLAEAVVAEIAGARESGKAGAVRLDALGLTRLAATAIDRIAPNPEATARALLAYAETDLVCYRAEVRSNLRARQNMEWQPLVDWLEGAFGARLITVEGVMPAAQSSLALDALSVALGKYDAFVLAGLGLAVQTAGSLVVGLALTEGRLDAAEAFALAELEETFQNEQWGEDAEALARRRLRGEDLALAERFLRLVGARGSE